MGKVIRTARISVRPVRISELTGPLEPEVLPEGEEETPEEGFVELGDGAEEVEEAGPAEAETAETAGEAAVEEGGPEAAGEPEAEEEPKASAVAVEALVEERLKEFEERFQAEKEGAYRSGFEDGRAEGLNEGLDGSRDEIDRFRSLVEGLTSQWQNLYKSTHQDLVDLALSVAKRIVGPATEVHEEAALQAVQECLGYLQDKSRVVIKVNPDDLDAVRRHRNDWLESLEGVKELVIEGDTGITRGGCIVETPKGDVDAQIEERLARLRAVITEELHSGDEADERPASDQGR